MELLSKDEVEKEEEYVAKMEEVIIEANAIAVMVVWEAKITLAKDVAKAGSWNLARWCAA